MVNEVGNVKPQVVVPIKQAISSAPADPARKVEEDPKVKVQESAAAGAKEKPSQEELVDAMEKMQDFAQIVSRDLNFSLDEDSGEVVIKVIDSATDEVVRQIPSEEALRVARALEGGEGFLMKTEA